MDDILRNGILSVITNYSKQTGLSCVFCPTYSVQTGELDFNANTNCDLCTLIQSTAEGKAACIKQRQATVERSFKDYNYQIITCHAGLIEWVVPVFYQNRPVGYFASGFVLTDQVNILKIENRQNIFVKRFNLSPVEVDRALTNQIVVDNNNIVSLAELLFSLAKLNIPSGRSTKQKISQEEIYEANFLVDQSREGSSISESMPLSYYICSDEVSKKQLDTFWKGIEVIANDSFMNTMAGNFERAYDKYNELMKLVYRESKLEYAKNGAEMLLHIIYLKYYNKNLYDTRFYRLSFETIGSLINATTMEEITDIMDNAFHTIYMFFNLEDDHGERKTVSPTIIKYLEENYAEEIKIGDIEKISYMSSTYASKLFKKETSFTIKSCLVKIRMKHAQELLLNTDIPIKDIAKAVGYTDIRGFYKMFAKHFGITCSEMREERINEKRADFPQEKAEE